MTFSKADLVELFLQLGYDSAPKWGPDKLRERARKVAKTKVSHILTKNTKRTLSNVRRAVGAEEKLSQSPPKKKRKKRTMLYAFPCIRLSRKQGSVLFAWLKKHGFVDPKKRWNQTTKSQKEELIALACVELIEEFCDSGEEQ